MLDPRGLFQPLPLPLCNRYTRFTGKHHFVSRHSLLRKGVKCRVGSSSSVETESPPAWWRFGFANISWRHRELSISNCRPSRANSRSFCTTSARQARDPLLLKKHLDLAVTRRYFVPSHFFYKLFCIFNITSENAV